MMIDIDEVVEIVGKAFRQASNSTIGYKRDQALEVAAKKIMTELQIRYLIHRITEKDSADEPTDYSYEDNQDWGMADFQ